MQAGKKLSNVYIFFINMRLHNTQMESSSLANYHIYKLTHSQSVNSPHQVTEMFVGWKLSISYSSINIKLAMSAPPNLSMTIFTQSVMKKWCVKLCVLAKQGACCTHTQQCMHYILGHIKLIFSFWFYLPHRAKIMGRVYNPIHDLVRWDYTA